MFAPHPLTGEKIRILNTEASVWRDQKNLVWFSDAAAAAGPAAHRWNRWEVGATSPAVAEGLKAHGVAADIVLVVEDFPAARAWMEAGHWSEPRVLAVSKAFVNWIGMDTLVKLRMTNLLCLDEFQELYAFAGAAWDGSLEDAKTLLALALRFGRSFPLEPPAPRAAIAAARGLRTSTEVQPPRPLWLVGQYYVPEKAKRRKEIAACLQKNLECPLVDRLVLLNERACAPQHPKLEEQILGRRLTYADVFRWAATEAPADALLCFANSDIFFVADDIRALWSIDMERPNPKFLALLRWDVAGTDAESIAAAKLFGPRPDSQDAWILSAAAARATDWGDYSAFAFPFGQGGCDNAVAMEMMRKKFIVANPALSLKTYHYHTSQVRTYDPRDVVSRPAYLYIQPTGLHDMRPVLDLKGVATETKQMTFTSFPRRVKGPLTPAQARTFCTMVARATQDAVVLDPEGENVWTPPPVPLQRFSDVFETRDGLLYTYDSILVGRTKASAEAWAQSQLSSLSPSLTTDVALVAHLSDAVAKNPAKYVLQYLAKLFLLRSTFSGTEKGEFWCAKSPDCIEALKMFQWPNREIPVLSRDESPQTWCHDAVAWMPQDGPTDFISREEVAALRAALGLGGWQSAPARTHDKRRVVVVVDERVFRDELVEQLEAMLPAEQVQLEVIWAGSTALEMALSYIRGADALLLFSPDYKPWTWVLPRGAYLFEVQSEMEPNAATLHLAAAAEVQHRLVILPKHAGALPKQEADALVKKLFQALEQEVMPKPEGLADVQTPKPKQHTLILPSGRTGFFSHTGDSFREMARIWAERGYVDLVEDPDAHQVWLDGVGETLLYDRPTLEWLKATPAKELRYKRALFGNPPPLSDGQAWTFWPRRPRLVEELVAAGVGTADYANRSRGVVFYGRSENAVQQARRTKEDWSTACDEFIHLQGPDATYPYTHEQYLRRLAEARYGLCLAGYGRKCHREIECMAMGCVPIVAADVDMKHYAHPPQAGVHYFSVKSPEEVRHIISIMDAERWTKMSKACRTWWEEDASADGSWELTRSLVE